MKQKIIAMAVIVLITGCVKRDPATTTATQQNTAIEGKVLSFTDNAPVSGATVVTSKCVQPDYLIGCTRWQDKTFNTSGDGSFSVEKGYESNMYVYKTGYWTCDLTTSAGSAGEVQYFTGTAGVKKIVVKLIEQVKVNVHVKNTSAIADSGFWFFFAEGIHPNKFSAFAVPLRKGIDTTFQYNAFGHLYNRFKVFSNDDYYNYLGYSGPDSILYSKDVFLATGSNTSIDINF